MRTAEFDQKYIVLTGNYGSGKTEIALNLALSSAKQGKRTTLVDLDIVNPYFRSGEKRDLVERCGIRLLMPTFALTTVDIPALPPEIQSVFETPGDRVIFDVGGDDTGAAALGRYYPSFQRHREETLSALVINCQRPLTGTEQDILDLADRIASRGRLGIDCMINNTNLADWSEAGPLEEGERMVSACAARRGIPRVLNAGLPRVLEAARLKEPCLPVRRYMVPEWMEES